MNRRSVRLIDPSGAVVAVAQVADDGGCYAGSVDPQSIPDDLRSLFDQWEQAVNDQTFEALDDLQDRISSRRLRALFDDGRGAGVTDLQVYPGTGALSFRLAEAPAVLMKSA